MYIGRRDTVIGKTKVEGILEISYLKHHKKIFVYLYVLRNNENNIRNVRIELREERDGT